MTDRHCQHMIAHLFAWWHRRVRAHYVIRRSAGTPGTVGQMTSTETERSYAHVVETLRRVTNERATLRRIIAEAPHGTGCESFWRKDGSRPCTCWKSRIDETR